MSDEAAFLRAICDQPDEDTPRLAFADWLTEQGGAVNVAWAAGIRAQVWLARGATDEALAFQACVFDAPYGRARLSERLELPEGVLDRWERGFPVGVSAPFDQLRDVWPGLASRVPIREFSASPMTADDVAEFVTWPGLTALRKLACGGTWSGPQVDLISPLAHCAGLRGLKVLDVHNTRADDGALTAVLDSPHLAGLQGFHISQEGSGHSLSDAVRDRMYARFGEDVFDDRIPF